jgi:hypothetical protein
VLAAKRQKEKEKEKEKEIERAKHSGTVPLIQNRKIAKIENKIGIKSEINNEDGSCEVNIVEKSSEEIEFEIDAAPSDDGEYSNNMILLLSTLIFNGCKFELFSYPLFPPLSQSRLFSLYYGSCFLSSAPSSFSFFSCLLFSCFSFFTCLRFMFLLSSFLLFSCFLFPLTSSIFLSRLTFCFLLSPRNCRSRCRHVCGQATLLRRPFFLLHILIFFKHFEGFHIFLLDLYIVFTIEFFLLFFYTF